MLAITYTGLGDFTLRRPKYLAPIMGVLPLNMSFSKKRYRPAGSVDSGPRNNARAVSVPLSRSKRSSSGVRAMIFINAWNQLRCRKG
jgi:hypothetical protein